MNCQACGVNPASIRSIDVVQGVKTEKFLCEPCSSKAGPTPFSALKLLEIAGQELIPKTNIQEVSLSILKKIVAEVETPRDKKRCKHCGMTLSELQKRGRIGCEHDYEVFGQQLLPLIERLHGQREHRGKAPLKVLREQRLKSLRDMLDEAVKSERYEEAARYRDEIKTLGSAAPFGAETS
jgi:protein arginine kinase activator